MALVSLPFNFVHSGSQKMVLKLLEGIRVGFLSMKLPEGNTVEFGSPSSKWKIAMQVNDRAFFSRIVQKNDVGLGESYMNGEWETDDLVGVVSLLIANINASDDFYEKLCSMGGFTAITNYLTRFARWVWTNTPKISHNNVKHHYDIGNDFYELMLDTKTMNYTCGLFMNPDDTLTQAQLNKMRLVIDKADIKQSDYVLELGCGWGAFAREAARTTGCRVVAYNLSEEQIKYAREKAKEQGLDHLVEYRQQDYRESIKCGEQKFDKIVSIGMMEHVGHYDQTVFFELCDKLLKPNGILVIHMITMMDQKYESYLGGQDFAKTYIFPGCCIPSITSLQNAMTKKSRFVTQHLENFGANYARTLSEWRKNYKRNLDKVTALGYDEVFQKMWDYYLAWSEAAFSRNYLGLVQMVCKRPPVDDPYPLGRIGPFSTEAKKFQPAAGDL